MDQSRMTSVDIQKLTNKKKQYLQDAINDKNGSYSYLDDPIEYKKARKRLQNRESAVRSRFRKKTYQETLEKEITEQKEYIDALIASRKELQRHNAALSSENQVLKQQVTYF
jgi:seryl-tRNA synthetase